MEMIGQIKGKRIIPFAGRFLLFFIILFLFDFGLGFLLRRYYFRQESGLLFRTTYSIDSTTANILVIGSSTANHHYIGKYFKNQLHQSFYNTGRDGTSILYSYSIFQCIIRRYDPKVIVLNLDVSEFDKKNNSYDKMAPLLPYYRKHPEIRKIIERESPWERYKLLSSIYPFNSLIFTIAIGTTEINKSREHIEDQEGYVALSRVWKKPIVIDSSMKQAEIEPYKIGIYKSIIQTCRNHRIRLFVVISPRFTNYMRKNRSIEISKDIARQSKLPFFDYSNDTTFLNHGEYFADPSHLNNTGAEIFSKLVADKINEHLYGDGL